MDYKKLSITELCLLFDTVEKIIAPYANFKTDDGEFNKEYQGFAREAMVIKDEIKRRVLDGGK